MSEATTPSAGQVATMTLRTAATTILKLVAGALIAHGYMKASGAEAFIGIGMVALTYVYSFWCDYGSVVAKAALDILRAKVLEAAAKARSQGAVPSAALASVAAHVQATTPAGGPAGAAEKSVINGVSALFAVLVALSFAMPATARTKAKVVASPALSVKLTATQVQQNPIVLLQRFTASDLQAALDDANAQTPPDTTSAQCYTALLALVKSPINNPLPSQLGIFLALQKARDAQAFMANLQSANGPLSSLNLACAPLVMNVNATLLALGVTTGLVAGSGGLAIPALPSLSGLLALLPIK